MKNSIGRIHPKECENRGFLIKYVEKEKIKSDRRRGQLRSQETHLALPPDRIPQFW